MIGFIFPYKITNCSVESYWHEKLGLDSFYLKHGPTTLGDNKVQVLEGETSIECVTAESVEFFKKFTEIRQVEIHWENN